MNEKKPERPRLFSGARQYENFARMGDFYPTAAMKRSSDPRPWPRGPALALPERYDFEGSSRSTTALLEATDTSALLVLQDGALRHEAYFLSGSETTRWISWSVAKSFTSALVGIAVEQGLIRSIEDPISDYVPVLAGSAYDGVAIRHVLQMSSGAGWVEDYTDPESDVNRLDAVMAGHATLDEFVGGIRAEVPAGTVCRYNSGETQALGMLLRAATGRTVADYMQSELCDPLGFQDDGYWLTDRDGVEMVLGGLNLTARDFLRIGELYRNGGRWDSRQRVPANWVEASVHADAAHLQPGRVIVGDHAFPFGYGYQWWLPPGTRGEFSAIGVYNQFVYVDPASRTVITKLSANPAYGTTSEEAENRDAENLALVQAIARHAETA
jgi:CubicO group peptidase (beta-lactamase class C family)